MVEKIWDKHDSNKSGYIERRETKEFLKETFEAAGIKNQFDDEDFEEFF